MKNSLIVFQYELANVLRSKWLYVYTALLAISTFGLSYLADDSRKTQLALVNILTIIVPLVSILFTTAYWYNSEKFTELLLAQPVSRIRLFWSRILALLCSLSFCLILGLVLTSYLSGVRDSGLIWLFAASSITGAIFSLIGALIATKIPDRMWGIGLSLACLFYFLIIHDSVLLLILYWFRDYPLELTSSLISGINPIGLMRVTLLMHYDAPLLLGHSGALVRDLVESGSGFWYSSLIGICWLLAPLLVARRLFIRRDF